MSSFPDFACSRSERPCLRSTINWWKAEIKLQNRHIYERQITQKTPDDNCKSYQQQKQQQLLQEQQRTTPKVVSTFLRFVVVKVVVIFFFSFLCQPILFLSPVSFFLLNTRTLFPLFRRSKREREPMSIDSREYSNMKHVWCIYIWQNSGTERII